MSEKLENILAELEIDIVISNKVRDLVTIKQRYLATLGMTIVVQRSN